MLGIYLDTKRVATVAAPLCNLGHSAELTVRHKVWILCSYFSLSVYCYVYFYLSFSLSVYLSILSISRCLHIYLSLTIYVALHLFIAKSIFPSIYLFIKQSICLSTRMQVYIIYIIHMWICRSTSFHLFDHLPITAYSIVSRCIYLWSINSCIMHTLSSILVYVILSTVFYCSFSTSVSLQSLCSKNLSHLPL